MLLSLLPISQTWAVVAAVLVPIALILVSIAAAPVIRVTDNLDVAQIKVPLTALGEAIVVEPEKVSYERGPGLSPGSKFIIRGDVKHLVKVPVTDALDPTSYLLLSTRRPNELASALNAHGA